jgi:SpoVK/Ycf46/Vps4 family AAA+-type ATPase
MMTSSGVRELIQKLGYTFDPANHDHIIAAQTKKQAKQPKVTLESVIISADKRQEIEAAISQVGNNDLIFETWGFSQVFEKGTAISLLFWGIPGGGKTLMSQAIADSLNAELKVYGTAEIQSSEPGGSERKIQQIFKEAKTKNAGGVKQVIHFDECDSLLMDRNQVGPILAAEINCLLSEIEHYDGVVIFTTNRLGKLDPALERRITAKIEFEFPDQAQRKAIWQRLIPKKAPLDRGVNLERLAEYPLAGGNIKNALLNAARAAAHAKSKKITMAHFVTAY